MYFLSNNTNITPSSLSYDGAICDYSGKSGDAYNLRPSPIIRNKLVTTQLTKNICKTFKLKHMKTKMTVRPSLSKGNDMKSKMFKLINKKDTQVYVKTPQLGLIVLIAKKAMIL